MNTILIWDQFGDKPITFAVLDGDQERFADTYINSYTEIEDQQTRQDELYAMVYREDGTYAIDMVDSFPHEAYCYGQTRVIKVGFVP